MHYLSDLFIGRSPQDSLLYGIYNPWLVLLSILVAIFASGMALQVSGMVRTSKSPLHRRVAIATGSIALGGGIFEKCRRVWKNCERKLNTSLQFVSLAFLALLMKRS
jgi:hypothetical protein